jgi:DNA-binding NtrC family response regulator
MEHEPNDLKRLLAEYERSLITAALVRAGGHQRRAADALGLLPSTLCEKMKRLGLRESGPPPEP